MSYYYYSTKDRREYDSSATNNKYNKFIVLGSPRVGSNWLLSALMSHPHVIAYNEIFNRINFLDELWGTLNYALLPHETVDYFERLRAADPVALLNDYIYRNYQNETKCVGFKLFYDQPHSELTRPKIIDYLTTHKEIKIIHLKRRNLFRMAVSLEIATQTKDWLKSPNIKNVEPAPFVFDFDNCLEIIKEREEQWPRYENILKDNETYTLYYEDLNADPTKHFLEIQHFLNLEPKVLSSRLEKQNTKRLSSLILNYEELKMKFSSTKWACFFDEEI